MLMLYRGMSSSCNRDPYEVRSLLVSRLRWKAQNHQRNFHSGYAGKTEDMTKYSQPTNVGEVGNGQS